jgi:hypothetical protein
MDALLSTVQMPGGIPVATMSLGKAGAKNAGIFAAQIIATTDVKVANRLKVFKVEMERDVEEKAKKLSAAAASEPAPVEPDAAAEAPAHAKKPRRRRRKKKTAGAPSQGSDS